MKTRTCDICGTVFDGHPLARVCSNLCFLERSRQHQARHRLRLGLPIRGSEESRRRMSEAARNRVRVKVLEPTPCAVCAEPFVPHDGRQKFCSNRCRARARALEKYGIDNETFNAMLDAQDGVCAICGSGPRGWRRDGDPPLVVDHDHATGLVRGLLCGECNTALGRFGDDPARLREAAEYLERAAFPARAEAR